MQVTIADVLKSKGTRQRNPTRGRCALRKNGYGGFLGLGCSFIFFQLLVLDDLCDLPYFETWSSHYLKNTARAGVSWLMPALPVHRWCCYFLRFPTPTKEDTASEHMPLPRLQSSFYDPTTSNFFFLSRAYLFCDDNVPPLLRSRFWVSEIDTLLCLIN